MTKGSSRSLVERAALAIVGMAGVLVPSHRRADFREEWRSEVWHHLHGRSGRRTVQSGVALLLRCSGAVWHALWILWEEGTVEAVMRSAGRAVRRILRSPGFALVAITTLGLGIGASAAVFSVVDGVLLEPLPFWEPDRLVRVLMFRTNEAGTVVEASYPDLQDWSREVTRLEGLAGFATTASGLPVEVDGTLQELRGELVTWNLFTLLGARTVLGRTFAPEDDLPGAAHTVVLSEDLWRDRFGADPDMVGRSLTIAGEPHEVIGVVGREFEYPVGAEIWVPVAPAVPAAYLDARSVGFVNVLGRLTPGATCTEALAELNQIVERVTNPELPASMASNVRFEDLTVELLGDTRPTLVVLFGATGLLLLIACANVANLQLVRGVSRRTDVAVRAALGAGRRRLVLESLLESALLATLGGAVGVLLAWWSIPRLVALSPVLFFRGDAIALNGTVVAFATSVTAVALALFGVLPAWLGSRGDLFGALRIGSTRGAGRRTASLMGGMVVLQFSLALVLAVGAGLLTRSFARLHGEDTGFERQGVLTLALPLFDSRYEVSAASDAFFDEVVEGVRGLPGVQDAGAVLLRPLDSPNGYDVSFTIEGRPAEEQSTYPFLNLEAATPSYFNTMSIPVLEGRGISAEDREDAPPVVLLSEGAARRFWPDGGAVGARIKFGGPEGEAPWMEVVGVVGDVRYRGMDVPRHDVYVPYRQSDLTLQHLVVRGRGDPEVLAAGVRSVVRRIDPGVRPMDIATTTTLVSSATARPRFAVILIATLGVLALVLGAVGIYGVLSYSVGIRRHEVGVRLALGARPGGVTRLVVWEGVRLALLGLVIGLAIAGAGSGILRGLLYEVGTVDPVAFTFAPVFLLLVAALTCLGPALRAARTEPAAAFRSE
ncbi:MAG: ABC transporter permease [Gemmatimonadota bacterium]|jgi:putative ABC transport system permease protein